MAESKKDLVRLRIKLEKAIDDGDMEKVDVLLDEISGIENISIEPEDTDKFAQDIRNKIKKGDIVMKKKIKFKKMAVIAAAITVTVAAGVSGSVLLKSYSFSEGDKFYTLSTNQDFDDDTLKKIEESVKSEGLSVDGKKVKKNSYKNFESVEEAEKYFDMKVCLPEIMPDLELTEVKGLQSHFGENNMASEIWATYGDINKKVFGISVKKMDLAEDAYYMSSNDSDEGSHGEYVSSKGYKFDKINESDAAKEKTANIYIVSKDNYQYAFSFYNFSNDEIKNIIDSVDLDK